jgi:hypothetical protein
VTQRGVIDLSRFKVSQRHVLTSCLCHQFAKLVLATWGQQETEKQVEADFEASMPFGISEVSEDRFNSTVIVASSFTSS